MRRFLNELCPDRLAKILLVRRRARHWKKAGVIFIHVPKNGGTSFAQALYGCQMGHYTIAEVAQWHPRLYAKLPSLGFTRNPWARLCSAYRFARAGSAMKDGAQIRHPMRYQVPAFESFERFVIEWIDGRDLGQEDYVFRPQSAFLFGKDGQVAVTKLGRLESLGSAVRFLEDIRQQPLCIQTLNATIAPVNYRQYYSTETRDITARAYAGDIDRFSYDY